MKILEMANRKRDGSVRTDDENGSKKSSKIGVANGEDKPLSMGFYTGITMTEKELEVMASGKPIPPARADEKDLFKLNTAVPGKMIRVSFFA
jgi:hypothetical protein